jgi:hypothetical protein
MPLSAFGVDHGVIAKAAELGSPAEAKVMEHQAGWHADKPDRMCDSCMNVLTRRRSAARLASKVRL